MDIVFYISAAVATVATVMVITRTRAVHALVYLIVSLLAVALAFFALGAVFVAALEVIIYAGAIMVLFVFVIMMLNISADVETERRWIRPSVWVGPALLGAVLFGLLLYVFIRSGGPETGAVAVTPKQVGMALYGPYVLGLELASMLLLAGLVAAYHLGHRARDGGADAEGEEGGA